MSLPKSAVAPTALLAVVACCDLALGAGPHALPVIGALDEPAHVATAALVLLALRPWRRLAQQRRRVLVVLAAAVLIDLDHIPLYAGLLGSMGGRPFSHSLVTVAVLLAASWMAPGRARCWLRAAALGVGLHFVRDVATGPGLRLLWPLTTGEVRLPYTVYAVALAVLGAVATWRGVRDAPGRERHAPGVPVPAARPAADRSGASSL